jgi:type VI secretion system protein ImpL
MRRLWQFLTDTRVLGAIGLVVVAAVLVIAADTFELAMVWVGVAALALVACWCITMGVRYYLGTRAASGIGAAMLPASAGNERDKLLREGLEKAIETIKSSKLGIARARAALYKLPWYMIIGDSAAGKSSAIERSGLQFPIDGCKAVQGVAGTRDCDWFFTTDGILLDTAGRYAVQESDRAEWFGFLALLRKHRRRAPINGILIAVSIKELLAGNAIELAALAKNLRSRLQEVTEHLRVHPPVYVIFTMTDLVAGFSDFFLGCERSECERVWGATMRYNRRHTHQDVLGFFDQHFDELHNGLKEMSIARMGGKETMRPGVFTFPLAFSALRNPLRSFLATLFEENAFQFKPVFRGFYFTSALQEGAIANPASKRLAERFQLSFQDHPGGEREHQSGYFLLDLFRKVIFADKELVARYNNPHASRIKHGVFFAAAVVLGCALGGWSWSTMGNRALVASVESKLVKVVAIQDKRIDLQSRLEALGVLQDRIEELDSYKASTPLALSFGMYQGALLERMLRDEYFAGVREVMVLPVTQALEALLAETNANAAQLGNAGEAAAPAAAKPGQPYQDATPTNVTDAYNALKTYLMLGDKSHAEPAHLNDQLTRYWRVWLEANRGSMPREQMIRSAERIITFHMSQVADPAWPQVELKVGLLDTARENLRRVVHGTPARERMYADIKARAATRFPSMTVARIVGEQDQALVAGSYAVPGTYTREAWEKFVQGAIREAASTVSQNSDWVLKTVSTVDLTLESSPEQNQRALIDMFKADYAKQWLKFVQGVSIAELPSFEAGITAMNRLGDPQNSPIAKLLKAINEQTAWDNPGAAQVGTLMAKRGAMAWIKEVVLRQTPSEARGVVEYGAGEAAKAARGGEAPAMGPIGREFAGVARLVGLREKDASLMTGYLDCLSRLRSRLNTLKNQGDPGPGARQFMQQTLEGSGSELADALKYVDEQMLTGMTETQKLALRPLLVRPLMQTFGVIVPPSEGELNKTWMVQVVEPFQKSLASKYPFNAGSKVEASQAEIGQLFGPDGAIAKFVNTTMGPLVVRRGDALAARTWADMGITLAPQAVVAFPGWVAPLSANGVVSGAAPQTVFQLQPMAAPGTLEYTVDIDGQQLRYRNTPPVWTNMVHPSPQGVAGARITAVTFDGRTVELFNEAGQFGLKRMIDAAVKKKKDGGVFELRWTNANVSVAVDLKIISSAETGGSGDPAAKSRGFQGMHLPDTIVGRTAGPVLAAKEGTP